MDNIRIELFENKDFIKVKEIIIEPKEFSYEIPLREDYVPTDILRKDVASELAEKIVNRLHYEKVLRDEYKEPVHQFSIWTCTDTDKDYYEKKINRLNKQIGKQQKILEDLIYENSDLIKEKCSIIDKYKNASLWDRVKYVFTKEIK